MIGPLTRELVRSCRSGADELTAGRSRESLLALAERLAEPRIRIAVGGRMNAGKSTLVNALLRQRLAATGATETTTLVTWFRYGHQDRLRLHLRDGTTRLVPAAPGGGVPTSTTGWNLDPAELTHITVEASNSALDTNHTIIDTPGLDSMSNLDEASLAALAHADAVLYLMPHPGEKDAEAVEAVRAWSGSTHFTTASIVGVLSRIDTLSAGGEDPWPAAQRVARRYGEDLASSFSEVLPVSGLIAETALGGEFSESDTRAITTLRATDPFDLEDALSSADAFLEWSDSPIAALTRRRLVALLGMYGLRAAVDLVEQGNTSTRSLLAGLRRLSGIDALLERVRRDFVVDADRLRATAAMATIRDLPWTTSPSEARVLQRVRADVDQLCLHPAMRQVGLHGALSDVRSGLLQLDPADVEQLESLAGGHDLRSCLGLGPTAAEDEVGRTADAYIDRWRTLEMRPSRRLRRHARAARELCEQMLFAS
ncbi:dynamin family protein [Actinomycetospora atypica]|uniref:Dynamin family protein n=1 Tax=Actinomycetospora atypica TaxID=1290095 RepID=A0ABV9YIP7_9PSEU